MQVRIAKPLVESLKASAAEKFSCPTTEVNQLVRKHITEPYLAKHRSDLKAGKKLPGGKVK